MDIWDAYTVKMLPLDLLKAASKREVMMESVSIVLMVLILMSTVFEMYALYTGDWKFPFWRLVYREQFSSVLWMSLLAYSLALTFGWGIAILSLLTYIFVYIALYFYITMKVPRKIYLKKISAFDIIFWTIVMSVIIFVMVLKYPQNAALIIIFSLLDIFFLFLPLYYLFEIREQKLEEKRQQEEESIEQEEEKKKDDEEWIIVTEEIDTNSKTEEERI